MKGSFILPKFPSSSQNLKSLEFAPNPVEFYDVNVPPTIPSAKVHKKSHENQPLKIVIKIENSSNIVIQLTRQEAKILTCGWLLSEVIRRIEENNGKTNPPFLYLKTEDKKYGLDFDDCDVNQFKLRNLIEIILFQLRFKFSLLRLK